LVKKKQASLLGKSSEGSKSDGGDTDVRVGDWRHKSEKKITYLAHRASTKTSVWKKERWGNIVEGGGGNSTPIKRSRTQQKGLCWNKVYGFRKREGLLLSRTRKRGGLFKSGKFSLPKARGKLKTVKKEKGNLGGRSR